MTPHDVRLDEMETDGLPWHGDLIILKHSHDSQLQIRLLSMRRIRPDLDIIPIHQNEMKTGLPPYGPTVMTAVAMTICPNSPDCVPAVSPCGITVTGEDKTAMVGKKFVLGTASFYL